ncbi:MAG: hypothetical protein ACREQ5_18920 [Candidatus Dormibacteria bacterium]
MPTRLPTTFTQVTQMLKPGDTLPNVALASADGAPVPLYDHVGKPLIVHCLRFYG